MIHYVKRQDLDIEKYDDCIEKSVQSRIYAFSWYLDIVAENWDVLVLDDYKAVMPIPWRKKYGIKYVSQPHFCQQLGIFSKVEISNDLQLKFINKIPLKFLKVSLNLNSENLLISKKSELLNYLLDISNEYSTIQKSFSKGRKHAIKVGEKLDLKLQKTTLKNLIDIQNKFYKYKIPKEKLLHLESVSLQKENGIVLGVFKNGVLLGGGFFIKSKDRIIYLYSAFSEEGRSLQTASFLISRVIKQNVNSNLILDFEGGNMPNIGRFYRSFGAKEENYSVFNRTLL
ncbi:hypothetical protein [uncultured Polaribacter sp.]|uniref:hypothetical protein n=1 Tax=uncultured Polaribacter sp. TaxID=174711 RepID=UPI002636291E|nr:hypothetical protein [uncultured Polaribacter sp.]